jgi:hypothetical protein
MSASCRRRTSGRTETAQGWSEPGADLRLLIYRWDALPKRGAASRDLARPCLPDKKYFKFKNSNE